MNSLFWGSYRLGRLSEAGDGATKNSDTLCAYSYYSSNCFEDGRVPFSPEGCALFLIDRPFFKGRNSFRSLVFVVMYEYATRIAMQVGVSLIRLSAFSLP